jgi:hypothetical protein
MKRPLAAFALITLVTIILLPTVLSTNTVLAQSSGYTIQSVEHIVEVMFSGHVVVRDDIKVSGSVTNGFQIGLPSKYGASVLKAVAYDENRVYPVELGGQLGNQGGFYAAQVNFEGANPQSFSVVFLLSNSLIGEDLGFFQFDYPAYPGFTTAAGRCKVTISLPAEPTTITISKNDGELNATTYSRDNLPAYTNMPGMAAFGIPSGLLQLTSISTLNRQISVNPAGVVSCLDSYRITNKGATTLIAFMLTLPSTAKNVVARDESGRVLTSEILGVAGNSLLVNATLSSYTAQGQSTMLSADYNLPSSSSGNSFNFTLFPAFNYYVDQATFTFTPPEGAKITTPQSSALDSSSTLTTNTYQDVLTVNRQGVSYVDSMVPAIDFMQITYDYNPIWSSFKPTFWAFGLSAIACVGIIFWRKRKPAEEEPAKPKQEKPSTSTVAPVETPQTKARAETPKAALRTTSELVRKFVDDYDQRKEISNEMNSLDSKAQKGKIPRRQYKVQRRALEVRFESLTKNINESKEVFRNAGTAYVDLVRQLDSAEANFTEADEKIKSLEAQQRSGEITIEEYKKEIGDYQRRKDKADNAINGILLRLREKMH